MAFQNIFLLWASCSPSILAHLKGILWCLSHILRSLFSLSPLLMCLCASLCAMCKFNGDITPATLLLESIQMACPLYPLERRWYDDDSAALLHTHECTDAPSTLQTLCGSATKWFTHSLLHEGGCRKRNSLNGSHAMLFHWAVQEISSSRVMP